MDSKRPALQCPICGSSASLKRCGSCKKVAYCSREHQRQHWKEHRGTCTYQSKKMEPARSDGIVVAVEIKPGEGLGLSNSMVKHVFDSLVDAKTYIRQPFGLSNNDTLQELKKLPFLTELVGFNSATLFLNEEFNKFFPRSQPFPRCHGTGPLNAMAIYLGCKIDNGLSPYVNASGVAFFIGTTASNAAVTSNVLWGASNYIAEAMDYYPDEYTEQDRVRIFREWSGEYRNGTYEPNAGTGGVNLFQTDPFACTWPAQDHRH